MTWQWNGRDLQKMTPKNIMDLFIVYTISKKTKDILVRNFLPRQGIAK